MLRHIVMWKFNEGIDREKIGANVKNRIEALCEAMPEVKRGEVIYNTLSTGTHDMLLSIDVQDEAALRKYAASKAHVEIVETLIKPNTNGRAAIDYNLNTLL